MSDEPKNDWPSLREPPETAYVGSDPFTGYARVLIIVGVILFGVWLALLATVATR